MRKILAALVALLFAVSFVGCAQSPVPTVNLFILNGDDSYIDTNESNQDNDTTTTEDNDTSDSGNNTDSNNDSHDQNRNPAPKQ
jgi:hypothetical protein